MSDNPKRKGGKKNRKFGRAARRPSHNRYNNERRWEKNKAKKQEKHKRALEKKAARKLKKAAR